jgi:ubiquinone/menaquinone biosynthesis C-methylase UbiE
LIEVRIDGSYAPSADQNEGGYVMSDEVMVDCEVLREQVREKYREGVANPFSLRPLGRGERVVDVGSGAGFDSFIAAAQVGSEGEVIGVDMTEEMLEKSRTTTKLLGYQNVEFRQGLAEDLPVENGWADVVISNGVINLCGDKRKVFSEIFRVLRPGGWLQFADIANGKPVPESAIRNVDLWTA